MDLAPRNRFYAATAHQFDLFYLISTFAPAASTFFLISSASCLVTPSLIVLGAPSTSALASAKPSPGTALRTSLITAILFEPISFKMTSNVLFSSAGAAAAPPAAAPPAGAPAAATGAAALTPHFSSNCLTKPAISSTDSSLSCSTNLFVSAIFFLQLPPPKAFGKLRPIAISPDSFCVFVFCDCRATPKVFGVAVSTGEAPALQNHPVASAGFPSFCAFAFSTRASAEPGSLNKRTRRVA